MPGRLVFGGVALGLMVGLSLALAVIGAEAAAETRGAPPRPGIEAGAEPSAALVEALRAQRIERRDRKLASERRFWNLSLARGGIALVGFAVFGWGVWLGRRGAAPWLRPFRLSLLSLIAVAAFAGYYNFFLVHHPPGFKSADVFHYYMGSKYFAELGYFELYHCTLAALIEDGLHDPDDIPETRDQRTLQIQPPETTRMRVKQCPEGFEPARWQDFKSDLAFFRPRILGGSWRHLLVDHGYNPTPVWAFVGGLVSSAVPAPSKGFRSLILLDRLLAVVLAGLIVWAFGLEVACLVAIVWGTSPLWSYNWIGDAFLRNLWLITALGGLCLLQRGRHFAAGVLLAAAALLRVFPAIFIVGRGLGALRRFREEGIPPALRRFALGVVVCSAVLLAAGALLTGRGVGGYLEFQEKMTGLVAQAGSNKIGLSALAGDLVRRATSSSVTNPQGVEVRLERPAPFAVGALRGAQIALVLLACAAFWRAAPRVSEVEVTALPFALIPLVTSPANYYYPFVLVAALLAGRRPWIGVALAVAATSWIGSSIVWFLDPLRYLVYDAVAVVFSVTVLVGVALTRPLPPAAPNAPAASTPA